VVDEATARFADHEVAIAVAVDVGERGYGLGADVLAGERIPDAGLLRERGSRRRARVKEVMERPVARARDEIEVAVGVEIDEPRGRWRAEIDAVQRVRRARELGECRGRRVSGIAEVVERPVERPGDDVEIAIGIEIPERRDRLVSYVLPIERVRGARQLDERRSRRTAGVAEIVERAVARA